MDTQRCEPSPHHLRWTGDAIKMAMKELSTCWTLPHANAAGRFRLLNRQLRTLYQIVPVSAASNCLSALWLLFALWRVLPPHGTIVWGAGFFGVQLGWAAHALLKLNRYRDSPAVHYTRLDLWVCGGWWICISGLVGLAVFAVGPYLSVESQRMLVVSFVPGFIAAGAMVSMTVPILSVIWLGVLIPASCAAVLHVEFLNQRMTLALLVLYAGVLLCASLSISRMFIGRFCAELAAEHEKQIVGLLLRDFEANASDWLWETDWQGHITRAGPRVAEELGLGTIDISGRLLPSLFAQTRLLSVPSDHHVGADALRTFLQQGVAFTGLVVEARVDGELRSWQIAAKPLCGPDGRNCGWRGVGSAVSDARARELDSVNRERYLHHLATHDALTGLPNRRAFFERLEALTHRTSRTAYESRAVLIIDLDNFKSANDALGHSVGDTVLKRVAARLAATMTPYDFLARLGGDEFAALIEVPTEQPVEFLQVRAQQLIESLREPEVISHFRIDVRGSIGAVVDKLALMTPGEVMRRADIALYEAKGEGRDLYVIYTDRMGEKAKGRLSMVSDLAGAIEGNELSMVYQCIVDVSTLRVIGCEALMRWHHPRYGAISPNDFIPVAEESGLIVQMGLWALEQACFTAAHWPRHIRIAVNVSAVQLNQRSFARSVLECLARAGFEPGRLELEITESLVVNDNRSARAVLDELRCAGVRIALDDFGTGYSSMAQVCQLPIDKLKLDRSFVVGLNDSRATASRSVISSIIHLGAEMNLSMTAEGIENATEFHALRKLGCQSMQGYLFGKPTDASQIERALYADYASQLRLSGVLA
ncbi:putative bifunctional diguanylate cyclase/phosphodiesterase [Paraburkholderia antibiotica]|uniref:EAL domain-containing protein n=1 Tax=Paraburkholderia antibiotica TaxID=2728839 RepID=A0A7X9ZXP4_9BURK|nr:EAL domain-containing protein [Paraburkholderia antibiotica]NML32319.1 EAL domain-containing protein [Paraburkholderia antibiotica]